MKSGARRADAVAVLLLVLMGFAHVAPCMFAGRTLLTNDYGAQFLPAFALLHGHVPFFGAPSWNPAIFAGAPAETLPMMARYPLAVMAYVLTPERAVPLFVGVHLALAAVTAFTFLRLVTNSSLMAAFLGAEIYAFGGTLWIHGMHGENLAVAAWLPAIAASAWGCGKLWRRAPFALAATTAMALLVGGGVPLLFFAVVASAVSLFAGMNSWRDLPRVAPGVALGLGLALLLSMPGWLPFVEVVRGASRGTLTLKDTSAFALSPPLLMRLAAPSLCYEGSSACAWPWFVERWCYVGILTLPLAGLGARDLIGKRLLLALFATVLLSFGTMGILHLLFYWIVPGYAMLRAPGRWIFLGGFVAAILAARGLDSVFREDAKPALRRALAATLAFALVALVAHFRWAVTPADPQSSVVRTDFALAALFAFLSSCWLLAVHFQLQLPRPASLAAGLLAADLLITAARVDVSEPIAEASAPQIVRDVAAAAGAARVSHDDAAGSFFLNNGGRWGYRNARGYSQLVPQPFSRLIDLGDEQTWHFSGMPTRFDPSLQALLGVDVWLGAVSPAPHFLDPAPFAGALGLSAWRMAQPPFRGALVTDFRIVPEGDVEREISLQIDPAQTAVVTINPGIASGNSAGALVISRDATDEIIARVSAKRPALAVINESWHRRWSATVDGTPAEILRADAIFMGVRVTPDSHEIRLHCRAAVPLYAWLASVAGMIGAASLYKRRS